MFCLQAVSLPAQTTFTSDNPNGMRLVKVNEQGTELPFTIKDAVRIVRFFMSQEGIQKCESDLAKNTLKIITRRGYDPVKILLNPALHNQISDMGYKIEFMSVVKTKSADVTQPATPAVTTVKPAEPMVKTTPAPDNNNNKPATTDLTKLKECDTCGDQKVSKEAIDRVVTPDAYDGTSILIDFGTEGNDSGGFDATTPRMSEAQLDSLRRALFKPEKPK